MSRKKVIAANWKMYKTPAEAGEFVRQFEPLIHGHNRDEIVICPPFVCLPAVVKATGGTQLAVGGQNMHWEREGAFTGEVSGPMLRASGCTHVILGHSERRQFFGETDETVNKKVLAALESGLIPIVCVGELLKEREAGETESVLCRQITGALHAIPKHHAGKICVAYEPVWAIGTGKTATPQLASDAHRVIRAETTKALGQDIAANMRILYGGSVKPENAKALMSEPEIDGALVGGASLDPRSFAAIVKW